MLTVISVRTNSFRAGSPVLIQRFGKRANGEQYVDTANFYEPTDASMSRLARLVKDKYLVITDIQPSTGDMMYNRNNKHGYAPVTWLHRLDISAANFSIDDISDADLAGIAEAMGSMYTGSGAYNEHLEQILDDEGVERLDE